MPSTAYLAIVKSYQFMSINAPQHQPAKPLPQHIAPVPLDKASACSTTAPPCSYRPHTRASTT